jgi:hypothetical protein
VTKQAIDWVSVEVHYRAGIRSLKDIGAEYGVSDAGILKRAKKEEWTRDLAAKIKAKAEAKVSAAAVSEEVSAAKALTEQAVVEANAELQTRIRLEQRQDVGRARRLVMSLFCELEAMTDGAELVELIAEALSEEGTSTKRLEVLNRVNTLGGRVSNIKALADSLKTLIALEREAFGIDDKNAPPPAAPISITF